MTALQDPKEPALHRPRDVGAAAPPWLRSPELIVAAVLAGILLAISLLRFELFVSYGNLRSIGLAASILLVLAVGQTFVIITGGIDLSVGANLVLSSVLSVMAMNAFGNESLAALLVGLGVALTTGLAVGLLNGALIARAGLTPIIVTLGTLSMCQGAAYILTDGSDLRDVPILLTDFFVFTSVLGLPMLVWTAIMVCSAGTIFLHFTLFGRWTYATGSDAEAARRAGINVRRHLIQVYCSSGLMAGLAGYLAVARFTTTSLAGYGTISLEVVTAVALGGASLFGGRGSILGSAVGVFIPVTLQNALIIMGVQSYWQQVLTGAVLIGAISLDRMRRLSQQRA